MIFLGLCCRFKKKSRASVLDAGVAQLTHIRWWWNDKFNFLARVSEYPVSKWIFPFVSNFSSWGTHFTVTKELVYVLLLGLGRSCSRTQLWQSYRDSFNLKSGLSVKIIHLNQVSCLNWQHFSQQEEKNFRLSSLCFLNSDLCLKLSVLA